MGDLIARPDNDEWMGRASNFPRIFRKTHRNELFFRNELRRFRKETLDPYLPFTVINVRDGLGIKENGYWRDIQKNLTGRTQKGKGPWKRQMEGDYSSITVRGEQHFLYGPIALINHECGAPRGIKTANGKAFLIHETDERSGDLIRGKEITIDYNTKLENCKCAKCSTPTRIEEDEQGVFAANPITKTPTPSWSPYRSPLWVTPNSPTPEPSLGTPPPISTTRNELLRKYQQVAEGIDQYGTQGFDFDVDELIRELENDCDTDPETEEDWIHPFEYTLARLGQGKDT